MAPALTALGAGVLAGLAVAAPLGAISVLILSEGLHRGFRHALAAAGGVALVDVGYAAAATAAGAAVTHALAGRTRAVGVVGAVVLVGVAARGLLGLRRAATATAAYPDPGRDAGRDAGRDPDPAPGPTPAAVLRRFVGLTLVNPLTAVYFVVLAAGLGSTVAGARAGTLFVAGVLVGSGSWQVLLASFGAFAGARLPPWARTATGVAGYLVVIGYAVRLAAG